MRVLEDVPRLDIAVVRQLPAWPTLQDRGGGQVIIEVAGEPVVISIVLVTDTTSLGQRWWFRCRCGARRRHLYLQDSQLLCRGPRCANLLYYTQQLADTRWRQEAARPALRSRSSRPVQRPTGRPIGRVPRQFGELLAAQLLDELL
jgi:hypothetical protein